ncbi:MAG: hypothetical protein ING02_07600, partial [Roseomonas sp.]|nr:hypothetical protein [Roseomonas sp.]
TGVLTLVPKPGKPADQVAGYRPITLLPVDLRIVARAVADRLQVPLDLLVAPTQSAFIDGRDISDNIHYHQCLSDYLRHRQPAAYALLLDLAGAYDNVDWSLLTDTMRQMGFQATGHVRWAQLLHNGATGQVLLNGHLGATFPIRSGLLQGSGVSPLYWCIVLQPLDSYLSSLAAGGRISTPVVPHASLPQAALTQRPAAPVRAHADDIAACVLTPACVEVLAAGEGCGAFAAAGGPALSAPKSVVQLLGPPPAVLAVLLAAMGVAAEAVPQPAAPDAARPAAQHAARPERVQQQLEAATQATAVGLEGPAGMRFAALGRPLRYLGTPVGMGLGRPVVQEAAFGHQPGAIQAASARWRVLALSLISRVHVAMQCLAAKLVFQLAYVQPTAAQLGTMQTAVRRFVATAPDPADGGPTTTSLHPNADICALPVGEGGLGYPSLQSFSVAMQAKLVAQLPGPRRRDWQPLLRALLADPVSGLVSWVVTAPTAVQLHGDLGRLQAHVAAFAELQVERVAAPEGQSFYSVLAEPLLHNPLLGLDMHHLLVGEAPLAAQAEARSWRYVRDMYRSLHADRPGPMPLALQMAAQLVLSRMPPAWQAHLQTQQPPPCAWECAVVQPAAGRPALWLARPTAAPGHEQPAMWATPCGRLADLLDGDAAALGLDPQRPPVWQPALVFSERRPVKRMSVEDLQRQRWPPEQRPPWPHDHWLLGPWDEVWLDPTVWGWHAGRRLVTLAAYTVRDARLRLTQRAWAAKEPQARPHGGVPYQPGSGVWPRLWGRRPAADAGPLDYDSTGLQRMEEAWLAEFQARRAAELNARPQGERDAADLPAWMGAPPAFRRPPARRQPASQPGPAPAAGLGPRPPQHAAPAAAVAAGAAVPRPPLPSTAVWRSLRHPALWEAHRTVAWRVLHGALPVGCYRLRTDGRLPAAAACCAACAAAGRQEAETLTHAFVACPAVAPALRWLLATYAALAGEPAPPADPLLVLGAAPWRWAPRQPTLWLHLRVAYLGCVWAARRAGRVTAAAVVEAVVASMTHGVTRDWRRVASDVRAAAVGIVPVVWFRGRSPRLSSAAFARRWPSVGGWYDAVPGAAPIVRLSPAWPVALQAGDGAAAAQAG